MIVQDTPAQEATKREMYRISQDDCMVYNPTEEDFYIEWDNYRHLVPSKTKDIGWGLGKRECKRYLAQWYCRHMKDKLINELGEKKAEEMLAKRFKEGKEEYTDFYVKSNEIYAKVPRTDDPKLMAEVYPTLFLGVIREFGLDIPEENRGAGFDEKTSEEKIMEQLSKLKYQEAPQTPAPTIKLSGMSAKEKLEFEKELAA